MSSHCLVTLWMQFEGIQNIQRVRELEDRQTFLVRGCVLHNTGWGGVPNLLQYCMGGLSEDPRFVLRNIWTAPKSLRC